MDHKRNARVRDEVLKRDANGFEFSLTIPGDPVVKGRPRFTRYGRAYTPKPTVQKEQEIANMAAELVTLPYDGRVGVEVAFFCATRRRTDGDNLLKLVMDGMNGVVFTDDYLVEEVRYRVFRKVEGEEPRTEVYVWSLD